MEVTSYRPSDCEILVKKVYDPDDGIYTGYIWNEIEHIWDEDWELTCGYFYGFEQARRIASKEAEEYIKQH